MPRKKPEDLKKPTTTAAGKVTPDATPVSPAPAAPVAPTPVQAAAPTTFHDADLNGDGVVDDEEKAMELEFRRKALEDQDAMRDAQRKMAWFALGGMLLYPFAVVLAVAFSLEQAATVLGSMAATYFVSVAAIVAAFFGGQAYAGKTNSAKKR